MSNRILLIEDSPSQALRIKLELLRRGVDVEVAQTGQAGLAAARSSEHHAIVLDVDLPDLDGYSLCRRLKEDTQTADIPVLMLTHRDKARDAMAGLELGAVDYIPKDSFAEDNLIASLQQLGII